MEIVFSLIDAAGFIALLLWGVHLVQTGAQRALGPNLRLILGRALRHRLAAFITGVGVTTIFQSSTATGLMTAGFAANGLVDLAPGLAVMLGANVGTTLIVQLLSFNVTAVAPVSIFLGLILLRRDSSPRTRDAGRVFTGFGLMLLALHRLLELVSSYQEAPGLTLLFGAVSTSPFLDLLLGAALTWATHSSVAVILLIISMASKGVVAPLAAFALVLGANLGTALNPVLEGPAGVDLAAKRLPIGNFLMRLMGVGLAFVFLDPISRQIIIVAPDNPRAVADFHTLFNVVIAAAFLPLLGPFATLLEKALPKQVDPAGPSQPTYLDPALKETPIVALAGAARAALRAADTLGEMLSGARTSLISANRCKIAETRRRDRVLHQISMAIKMYLASLDPDALNEQDQRRCNRILCFTMSLEQAGDVIDRNLLTHAAKRLRRGLVFGKDEESELLVLIDRLALNLRVASALLQTEDPGAARTLAAEKIAFRDAEAQAAMAYFAQLRNRRWDATHASALHLALLRDMKLINSHIVSAAAYPVLEREGELLRSRLVRAIH